MAAPQYPNLKRKASRWHTRPPPGGEDGPDIEVEKDRASLLLFVRDLAADEEQWHSLVDSIANSMEAQDATSVSFALGQALFDRQHIAHDYIPRRGTGKRRRLRLLGNPDAGPHVGEHDELINLARTVWNDPCDLGDVFERLYAANLIPQPPAERPSLQDVFGWARCWAEVRYRFMNHALKDDPLEWVNFMTGPAAGKGNAANELVHSSDVIVDCQVVAFSRVGRYGFNNTDRRVFNRLYLLTLQEGQQLVQFTGQTTGLRAGLPEVFRFCVQVINAYMNWRVQALATARLAILKHATVVNAPNAAARRTAMTTLHTNNANVLKGVDDAYDGDFLLALKTLLAEAATNNAFLRSSYDTLDNARTLLTNELRACTMNTNKPALRSLATSFPGANVQLRAPTGTSINTPRRTLHRL